MNWIEIVYICDLGVYPSGSINVYVLVKSKLGPEKYNSLFVLKKEVK
jgi:hypothetical protein